MKYLLNRLTALTLAILVLISAVPLVGATDRPDPFCTLGTFSGDMLSGGSRVQTEDGLFYVGDDGYVYQSNRGRTPVYAKQAACLNYVDGVLYMARLHDGGFDLVGYDVASGTETVYLDNFSGELRQLYVVDGSRMVFLVDHSVMELSLETRAFRMIRFAENLWSFVPTGCGLIWASGTLFDYRLHADNYLIADAVNDEGIRDVAGFKRFIRACAALVGNLVNYRTLGEAAGVSEVTARKWVGILQDMDVVYLLEPYSNNELQRLVKTPKLYFCDTGLCAYLTRWLTPQSLREGAASGHIYENYVVMELVKNYAYARSGALLSFYRDDNAREIDIFIEENGMIHPLEIKKSANPEKKEIKKFAVIEKTSLAKGSGGIVCMFPTPFPIDDSNSLIPSNLI